jgi:hypothetical protein
MITGLNTMHKHFAKILLLFLALAWETPVAAQEEEPAVDDANNRRCLSIRRIRSTRIIDDRNMLFYTPGRVVYHNILRQPCNSLEREGRFSYQVTTGSLCSGDMIFVLHDDAFNGFRRGNACSLGIFHEITREDATALIEGKDARIEAVPLPMPEPEEIGSDKEVPQEPENPED